MNIGIDLCVIKSRRDGWRPMAAGAIPWARQGAALCGLGAFASLAPLGFRMKGAVRMGWRRFGTVLASAGIFLLGAPLAFAEEPEPWQFGFQAAASPVREHIDALHNELLIIITAITLFVLGLLLYVIVRFRASRHPVPSRTTHNSVLELVWTGLPVLILLVIAIPSF